MPYFLFIFIGGYILLASLLVWFFHRDKKNLNCYLGKHKKIARTLITILTIGIISAISCYIQPWFLITNKQEIKLGGISDLKIAFITDIQAGNHKKSAWVEKIVERVEKINPDLVILGGDLIDNERAFEDESQYLEPLAKLVGQYPIYYILGNHEYGTNRGLNGEIRGSTGDRSVELIARMQKLGIPILRNQLDCPTIKNQKLCLFGIDDIWVSKEDFTELNNWDKITPLIFLTHNPDGILSWPKKTKKPDLVLAGHTHGGQIWLPGIGPLGNAQIQLPKKYYRGLNYYNDIQIFTSVGAGESGGPIRFWVLPEVAEIKLK